MDDYYTYMQDSSGRVFIPSATWPIVVFSMMNRRAVAVLTEQRIQIAVISRPKAVADIHLNANLNAVSLTVLFPAQQEQDLVETGARMFGN
ncbi:MAG: hypothetical protein ACLUD0_09010 [Eubacterium ramulus]